MLGTRTCLRVILGTNSHRVAEKTDERLICLFDEHMYCCQVAEQKGRHELAKASRDARGRVCNGFICISQYVFHTILFDSNS